MLCDVEDLLWVLCVVPQLHREFRRGQYRDQIVWISRSACSATFYKLQNSKMPKRTRKLCTEPGCESSAQRNKTGMQGGGVRYDEVWWKKWNYSVKTPPNVLYICQQAVDDDEKDVGFWLSSAKSSDNVSSREIESSKDSGLIFKFAFKSII